MSNWNYIVVILCLLLLAFTCWKEWRRVNRGRLVLRLLASFFAVLSFACLALPLTRKVKHIKVEGKQAVLLTEGCNIDSVNGFLGANKNIPVYAIDNNVINAAKNIKIRFLSIDDLAALKTEVSAIHVFGYGMDKEELQVLPASLIKFHPAKLMNGIIAVTWQHKIKAGDQLTVQGNFINTSPGEIKLIFSGHEVNLDTAIIPANKQVHFELSAVPKQLGKAVYRLTALSGTDTLEREPVPFEIALPGTLKVLILASSPDFENKFLKSWLLQNSYAVVTRTTTSKNKYEKTFANTDQVAFGNITTSFLRDFDLVIADMLELNAISKSELAAIESQVAQKGMGLIVRGDSASAKSSFYSQPFPVLQNPENNQKDLSIYIPVSNQYATVFAGERMVHIRAQSGTKSLIQDKQSNIIVSSAIHGAGKLVYTTLNNTFTWMLSGNNKNYQTFWTYLLENATAKTSVDKSWSISPAYPYANKAVEIKYTSNNSETPRVQIGEDFVYLIQNPDLTFQWRGSYWPTRAGWQPILQQDHESFWWYAYGTNDWKMISASQKIKATLQGIAAVAEDGPNDVGQNVLVTVPLSKKYFFVMFLFCVGFLWLEKKL